MRNIWTALLVTMVVSPALGGQAPGKVSLTDVRAWQGTWVLDVMASGVGEADAERKVMTLGPTWVRIDTHRTADAQPVALIYNLDGSPNVNPFGAGVAVTKLTRDGDAVMLETVFTVNNQAVTLNERVPLVPGLDLPVEVMLRVEHGYQGVAPAGVRIPPNVSSVTKIYRKE